MVMVERKGRKGNALVDFDGAVDFVDEGPRGEEADCA